MYFKQTIPDEWREVELDFYSETSRRMVHGTVWALFDCEGNIVEFDERRATTPKGTINPYDGIIT